MPATANMNTENGCSFRIWIVFLSFFVLESSSTDVKFQPLSEGFIDRLCDISMITQPDVIRVFYDKSHPTENVHSILRKLNRVSAGFLLEVNNFDYEIKQLHTLGSSNFYKSVYLMILRRNSEQIIDKSMQMVRKTMRKKNLTKFIVVIEVVVLSEVKWMDNIGETFWDKHVINVIVMCFSLEGATQIFSYDPFEKSGLQIRNLTNLEDAVKSTRTINNLHGYNLTVSLAPIPIRAVIQRDEYNRITGYKGIDVIAANLIGQRCVIRTIYLNILRKNSQIKINQFDAFQIKLKFTLPTRRGRVQRISLSHWRNG